MKFIIIIYTTNKLTVVEMEDIRGVRLRKFKLRKIVLGVRMHFHHISWSLHGILIEMYTVGLYMYKTLRWNFSPYNAGGNHTKQNETINKDKKKSINAIKLHEY